MKLFSFFETQRKLFEFLWNFLETILLENSSLKLNIQTWNYWIEIGASEGSLNKETFCISLKFLEIFVEKIEMLKP